jgi:hypothetical protein
LINLGLWFLSLIALLGSVPFLVDASTLAGCASHNLSKPSSTSPRPLESTRGYSRSPGSLQASYCGHRGGNGSIAWLQMEGKFKSILVPYRIAIIDHF